MISCNDYQNMIVAVLDNESNPENVRLVFNHLADCEVCLIDKG